jgi:hypothetical protein
MSEDALSTAAVVASQATLTASVKEKPVEVSPVYLSQGIGLRPEHVIAHASS